MLYMPKPRVPMERASKVSKKLLLLLLPKATSAVTFLSPPPSPHKPSTPPPYVSIIPAEARRRKPKNGSTSFDSTREPTSPKVSCLGQVQKKKKPNSGPKTKPKPRPKSICCVAPEHVVKPPRVKKAQSKVGPKKDGFELEVVNDKDEDKKLDGVVETRVPSLGQMRRFESGRGVLSDFDWTTANNATPIVSQCQSKKITVGV